MDWVTLLELQLDWQATNCVCKQCTCEVHSSVLQTQAKNPVAAIPCRILQNLACTFTRTTLKGLECSPETPLSTCELALIRAHSVLVQITGCGMCPDEQQRSGCCFHMQLNGSNYNKVSWRCLLFFSETETWNKNHFFSETPLINESTGAESGNNIFPHFSLLYTEIYSVHQCYRD